MNTSTSEARRLANRRNSQKSTGPKTEAGKAISRRNSLKHGLTSTVVDLDDLGPRGDGAAAKPDGVGMPRAAWQLWLADQVARATDQIARAQRIEGKLRDQAAWRAITLWDDDRDLVAEELGADLSRDPSTTVARLRRTPQGCDWLIRRWGWLVRAVEDRPDGWTEDQTRLAFELLGTPEEGRTDAVAAPLDLARAMIIDLQAHRVVVADADEIDQSLAEAGLIDIPTRDLSRLRRYEGALHKRLQWLLSELRGDAPDQQHLNEPAALLRADGPPSPEVEPARNEAKLSTSGDETKPTPPGAPGPAARNRPDLAKIIKGNRQKRRDRRRNRQLA